MIDMKSRAFLWGLGIIGFSSILSIAIYSNSISEIKPKYDSLINSLEKSYSSDINKSEIMNDEIFDSSALPLQNQYSAIRVTSGYKSLGSYAERVCYHKIKSGCHKILTEKNSNGLYDISPIMIEGCRLDSSQLKKILYAVRNDYPEFFWISSTFGYMYPKDSTVIKLNSTFSKQEKEKAEDTLNKKVSEITSKALIYSTDYERELFFHDYLVEHCKYESNYNSLGKDSKIYSSYGCLIDGRAVCEGYSSAMQLLLNSVGIDARTVSGFRGKEPHMWNIVKINDKWYHLDVTWDGSGEFQKYFYFNIDDNTVKYDHIINEQLEIQKWPEDKRYNFSLPICNSNEYNYFERNAFKFSSLNNKSTSDLTNYIINLARRRYEYLYIMINKNSKARSVVSQNNISREFFKCISDANKYLDLNCKITNKSLRYSICDSQNVVVIKLTYK